jgi:hypothetical protein
MAVSLFFPITKARRDNPDGVQAQEEPDLSRWAKVSDPSRATNRCVTAEHVGAEQHHRETENRKNIDFTGGSRDATMSSVGNVSRCELWWPMKGCAAVAAIDRHRAA